MSSVHDFIIKKYLIDFEKGQIVFDIYNESVEKKIIFHDFFTYKFYDEIPYSIILDLQKGDMENFFSNNMDILKDGRKNSWPVMYDSIEELKKMIYDANLEYQYFNSSYGLYGWVLAKKTEVIDL